MKHDLFNPIPPVWHEQRDLANKIGQARNKAEKRQLATLLCASLVKMTAKQRTRH